MASEERSSIQNGIWLCQSCATLIDRDEERFSVDDLRQMKRDHEASRHLAGVRPTIGGIVAISPKILAFGSVLSSGADCLRIELVRFLKGDSRDLLAFASEFDRYAEADRYVLLTELGSGGLVDAAPVVERTASGFVLTVRFQPPAARRRATEPLTGISGHTGEVIRGMDVLVQNFEGCLGMAKGTWFLDPKSGSALADLYWEYCGTPDLEPIVMLEIIRLSSIPTDRNRDPGSATPMLCVTRVRTVAIPHPGLDNQRLRIDVEFELEGLGPWSGLLSAFVHTPEQLTDERAKTAARLVAMREMEAGTFDFQAGRPW